MFAEANNYMKDGVLLRQIINTIDDLQLDDYAESHAFGEIYETIHHSERAAKRRFSRRILYAPGRH